MKLYCNRPSPYGRKVLVAAHESGVFDKISIQDVDPWADPLDFHAAAPIGKIPALITGAGVLLTESLLICDFLFAQGGKPPLDGDARIDERSRSGLFQGLIDAAFISVIERRRPKSHQWEEWIDRQQRAIQRTLSVTKTPPLSRFDLGDISLACGLAYLDFRLPQIEWRNHYPDLAGWLDEVQERRSMIATNPDPKLQSPSAQKLPFQRE